jgi:hypothetical protein
LPLAPGGDDPVDESDIRMPRRPYRPLVLLAGALTLSLCLVRPALADPSADGPNDADIVVTASVHAAAARPQRDLFATADTGLASEFDIRDVELFEASLPHDIPDPAGSDPAASALAGASVNEVEPPLTSAAEIDVPDFDVALFEAALPREISVPAARDPAIATLAAARPRAGKPLLKPAANHPRNKTPAAKQPLRSATAHGKTNGAAGTSRPAPRSVAAAAPPATIPHARPRAGKADHGPRELLIARVPPSDRDEVMPAQRLIPVIRLPLPSPSLALK